MLLQIFVISSLDIQCSLDKALIQKSCWQRKDHSTHEAYICSNEELYAQCFDTHPARIQQQPSRHFFSRLDCLGSACCSGSGLTRGLSRGRKDRRLTHLLADPLAATNTAAAVFG